MAETAAERLADLHLAAVQGEEILRTTFLPEDVLAGTKLFLTFESDVGQYVVRTRFQDWYRSRKGMVPNSSQARQALHQAEKVFEEMLLGNLPGRRASKKQASGVSPILASVSEYSVWLHCKLVGYGRIHTLCGDLQEAEKRLHAAARAVQDSITKIDGVFPDVWDSHAQILDGQTMMVAQKIKLSGGVDPEQERAIGEVIKGLREVKGLAPVPKGI
jgi:hypothetical protein